MYLPLKEMASLSAKKAELLKEEALLWHHLAKIMNELWDSTVHRATSNIGFSQKRYLSSAEAAEYLGIAVGTTSVWRCVGKGPSYVKIGRVVRYTPASLDEFTKVRTPSEDIDWPQSRR